MPRSTPGRLHPGRWLRTLTRPASAPPRILHVLSSLHVGGMEQFVVRIAEQQQSQGMAVGILALRDGPLRDVALCAGLPIWFVEERKLARRILAALRLAARWSPDVVHVHNTTSLQYGTLCFAALGCPCVMTFHGQGQGFARHTTRLEWRAVAAVAAVSRAASLEVAGFIPPERLTIIPNGVGIPARRGNRGTTRERLELGSAIVGIIVARMDGMKGHGDLLEAMALVRRRGGRALTVLFAGDGAERPALEAQARRLELDASWVRFLGYRSDIPDLLEAADFFILPSLTEGMPLSVLEAMAAGLPTVATDVGGIPEIVTQDREALLVPARRPEALADAMTRLAGDAALRHRLGEAALTRVRREFSFEGMLDRYQDLYRSVGLEWVGGARP